MNRWAVMIAAASLSTSAIADEISVGRVTPSMSFDDIERIVGPGEVTCSVWSPGVDFMCIMRVQNLDEQYDVLKSPEGETLRIQRWLPLPDSLSDADAFDQVRSRYPGRNEFGVPPFSSALYLMCPDDPVANCNRDTGQIEAGVLGSKQGLNGRRTIYVAYTDHVAMRRNQERVSEEVEARKPRLPL